MNSSHIITNNAPAQSNQCFYHSLYIFSQLLGGEALTSLLVYNSIQFFDSLQFEFTIFIIGKLGLLLGWQQP